MAAWEHQHRSVTLSGDWKIRRADEHSRRTVADVGLDDSSWIDTQVPGHWRHCEGLDDADAVLYRHHFEAPKSRKWRRWLSIDGLMYQGDIWLDGAYLGDTEGYFAQHVFDVTQLLNARRQHVVAIEATCSQPTDRLAKTNLTGVLQHSDFLDHDLNPGGLWRDVRIEETGPVRIDDLSVLVLEADADRAIMRLTATLDSAATHTATVTTHADPAGAAHEGAAAEHHQDLVLARGRNEVEWHVAIESPELWWPRALGDQALYDLRVEVEVDGAISHVRKRRTGMRTIELRNWIAAVNGERLYLKGANLGPASIDLASTTAADHRRDLTIAADAGLDLLRVHGHVAAPDLYREADRLGLLLWQDFPLQWGHARSTRRQATKQAERLVGQLGHHPSIMLWSGHNEPGRGDGTTRHPATETRRRFSTLLDRNAQLPNWNRTILDHSVRTTLEAADPTRPVIAHSGVPPHFPQLDGTDSHLYFGWHYGDTADLADLAKRVPRTVRFVSEFGAQAIPANEPIADAVGAHRFPGIDRGELTEALGARLDLLEAHTPRSEHSSWNSWVMATQRRQAEVIRHSVEILRSLKYRPNGGYCQFLLNDAMPYVSCAVLDHMRRPKLGWHALAAASAPLIVVADLHRPSVQTGTTSCAIHVISDLRRDVEGAIVHIEWRAPGIETRRWERSGSFDADSVSRVAKLRLAAPQPGPATLDLRLEATGISVTNRYEVDVEAPAPRR